jgi:diguanylate cyclase (GGDEF)-like protein
MMPPTATSDDRQTTRTVALLLVTLVAGCVVAPAVPVSRPITLGFLALCFALPALTDLASSMRARRRRDPLTGVLHRVAAAEECRELARSAGSVTVLLAAINEFAEINEALGTLAGEQLLGSVAQRLTESDLGVVARTGTNEFAVLIAGDDRTAAAAAAGDLLAIAHHLPFTAGGAPVVVDWSVGVAISSTADDGFERLLGQADLARQRAVARQAGFEIHDPARYLVGQARLSMLADLRVALDEGQFCVRYQPKARAADGRVVGVEALVRWDHPVHGLVGPDAFLPLMQHTGLSRALTITVITEAIEQVGAWRAAGHDLTLAVNVTPRDLQDPGFPAAVATVLGLQPGAAQWLQLEVTETSIVGDEARTTETLTALAGLGLKLAIDDFGAGATSLVWLRDLPVTEVKLDKNYVREMGGSFVDTAIVRAVIDLAHRLRLRVVAEGVEDAQTWRELAHMGCDVIQGYHLCPPLAGMELTAWLDRSTPDPRPISVLSSGRVPAMSAGA